MSPALIEAAVRLADALALENEALNSLDLARAAKMLSEKQRAADAFIAVQAIASAGADQTEAARQLAERLGELARENRRLLERALAVQGRIVGILARATRPQASCYSARGKQGAPRRGALTLSARV